MSFFKEVINPKIDTAEKLTGDGLSVTVLFGVFAEVLPVIAVAMTVLWTGIRIWETDTVQKMFKRKKPHDSD